MKKVLIVAPEYMGYIVKVADELRKNKDLEVTDIQIPTYKYSSLITKVKNFYLKRIAKDVKFKYRENYIKTVIKNETFDIILIIRPDLFSVESLVALKSKTKIFILRKRNYFLCLMKFIVLNLVIAKNLALNLSLISFMN